MISAASPFLLLIDGGTVNDSYLTFAGTNFSPGASPIPQPETVPEPSSLPLLALALAALPAAVRRRQPS